mgnify:FL=1
MDRTQRLRISASVSRQAGFSPGQRVAVIANSKTEFTVVPSNKVPRNTASVSYTVEADGRIRVARSVLKERLGVSVNPKKSATVSAKRSRIDVTF